MELHFTKPIQQVLDKIDESEVHKLQKKFESLTQQSEIGFYRLDDVQENIEDAKVMYQKFKSRRTYVHVGIGGSSLGAQTLVHALSHGENQTKFLFLDNIDADEIHQKLEPLNPTDCVFTIVSKSGKTPETLAIFNVLCHWLDQRGISEEDFPNYFVFVTDPQSGPIRKLIHERNFLALDLPSNIGGRFSFMTSATFFPALFLQLNLEALCHGVKAAKQPPLMKDWIKLALALIQLKDQKNISQTVLMPYSSKLKTLSHWFVQLWAESLGKKHNLDNKEVHCGLTPIPAFGATDQHSQMQLFMHGPYDKFLMIIRPLNFHHDYDISPLSTKLAVGEHLQNHSLSQLMQAECLGTWQALETEQRLAMRIDITNVDEISLGKLVFNLECLTALVGLCLNINAFDQPGVELGKKLAINYLKNIET